jgi:hypothetical protein
MKRVKSPNGKWEFYLGERRISRFLYWLLTGASSEDDPFEQVVTYRALNWPVRWTWPKHRLTGRFANDISVTQRGLEADRYDQLFGKVP